MIKGFTLTEVLITLVIVGIIASITIPLITTQYTQSEAVSRLQKMYSTLRNAATKYQAQNGAYINDFDTSLSSKDFMDEYFVPYLQLTKYCGKFKDCYSQNIKILDINGNEITAQSENIMAYGAVLSDGTFIGITSLSVGVIFWLDINGDKGPNKVGRDIFNLFLINADKINKGEAIHHSTTEILDQLKSGIYPGGYAGQYMPHAYLTREQLLNSNTHRSCNRNAKRLNDTNSGGSACAAVIMMDGWKIKKDYPW